MNLNFNNPNSKIIETRVRLQSKARQMQHDKEMELLMTLFDIDSLEEDEEEGGEEEIEVSKEDVEIELMLIDDFRDVEIDMNQDEIAKHFNVSQVQVSRMEKKIIQKLKKQFN